MDTSSLSDTFFTIFLLCAISSALLFTNGAMLNRIGLFNAINRSSSTDASKFNDFALFTGTQNKENQENSDKSEKDSILEFTLIMTIGFFILFVFFEFVIG